MLKFIQYRNLDVPTSVYLRGNELKFNLNTDEFLAVLMEFFKYEEYKISDIMSICASREKQNSRLSKIYEILLFDKDMPFKSIYSIYFIWPILLNFQRVHLAGYFDMTFFMSIDLILLFGSGAP